MTTLIIEPMMLVVIGIIATILVKRESSEAVTTTTTNITMTTHDFTSTLNPFICDKKWIGDGICDVVVFNLFFINYELYEYHH